MAKSGITRRIDELGRIVIPKEIRSNLSIRNGELLEMFIEDKKIIIKKYSEVLNIIDISQNICNLMSDICNIDIIITDRDKVIVVSNNLKNILNIELDNFLKKLIDNSEIYISNNIDKIFNLNKYFVIVPIISSITVSGLVIIVSNKLNNENITYAKIIEKIICQNLG